MIRSPADNRIICICDRHLATSVSRQKQSIAWVIDGSMHIRHASAAGDLTRLLTYLIRVRRKPASMTRFATPRPESEFTKWHACEKDQRAF